MNYHDIKILHIFFAVLMIVGSLSMVNSSSRIQKITFGLTTLLSFASGYILMERFGIRLGRHIPLWIIVKTSIWLVIAVMTPIIIKRLPKAKKFLILPWIVLLFVSIAMAVYKPL